MLTYIYKYTIQRLHIYFFHELKVVYRHTNQVFITVLFVYYPYMVSYSITSFLLKLGQDLLNDPHHHFLATHGRPPCLAALTELTSEALKTRCSGWKR